MKNITFEELLAPVSSPLFRFALKLTGDITKAEDLYQETIFKAFKKRDSFIVGSNFKAWITTIMYNTNINNYRKEKKQRNIHYRVEDESYRVPSNDTLSPQELLEYDDVINELYSLKDIYKDTVLLYLQGYKYEEIATLMKLPVGTVKSRINKARQQIAKAS